MASAAAAMRKTVTVLFCDLADSTELGERLDPERFRELLAQWYGAMREPIERHGGTVEKFIGDAVMAVFGVPHVHEDDALRAVRAAVEMRAAVLALNEELAGPRHVPLAVRIGINTGEVVTGETGATLVSGDAVNTAKRLEQAAPDGEILVGAATRLLVQNAVRLEGVEPVRAKGKREPVEAWRVVATIPGATAFARRLDAPLVGRRNELAVLQNELAVVSATRTCRLVTLVGPAGIGKSRLAAEAVRDGRAVVARCLPYGDGLGLSPLVDLVHAAGGVDALRTVLDADVATRVADGSAQQEELQYAVRRLLETTARQQPVAVVLEDVHWAQPAFLDLVEYLAGWSTDAPILLLCVARPDLLEERPRWPGLVVTLPPLTDPESQQLLDALAAEWPLDARSRERISEAADGNPLFLEQLVAMLADGGGGHELPPTIQALLAARLDALAPEERSVVERAAVLGRDFTRSGVTALSGNDEMPTLLALVRRDLLRPAGGDDGFRFRHALIRDAAYATIAKRTRAELHERAADWFAACGGDDELVGYHLEQASRCHFELGRRDDALATRAGELLGSSGLRAATRGDVEATRSLLTRSLALLPPAHSSRPELLREASTALWLSGDVDAAELALTDSISAARAAGNVRLEWYGRLDRAARNTTAEGGTDVLAATAERAVAVFEELGDELGLARAWRRLGLVAYTHRRFADAAAAFERALRHAEASGDAQERARAADALCTALVEGPARAEEAVERIERILETEGSNVVLHAHVTTSLAELLAMRGDLERARELLADAEETYDALGLRLPKVGWQTVAASTELLAGDIDAAIGLYRNAFAFVDAGGYDGVRVQICSALALALAQSGEAAQARRYLRLVEHTDGQDAKCRARLRAAQALVAQAIDEAEALAEEAVTIAEASDDLNLQAMTRATLARIRNDADELGRARELYERKGNVAAATALGLWSLQR